LDFALGELSAGAATIPWLYRKTLVRERDWTIAGGDTDEAETPLQAIPWSAQLRLAGAERLKEIPWSPDLIATLIEER